MAASVNCRNSCKVFRTSADPKECCKIHKKTLAMESQMLSCKFLESFYCKTLPGVGFLKVKKGLELVKIKLLGTRATFKYFFLIAYLPNCKTAQKKIPLTYVPTNP